MQSKNFKSKNITVFVTISWARLHNLLLIKHRGWSQRAGSRCSTFTALFSHPAADSILETDAVLYTGIHFLSLKPLSWIPVVDQILHRDCHAENLDSRSESLLCQQHSQIFRGNFSLWEFWFSWRWTWLTVKEANHTRRIVHVHIHVEWAHGPSKARPPRSCNHSPALLCVCFYIE